MASAGSFWAGLSSSRRWALGLGVTLIVAIGGLLAWWATRASYAVLFNGLRPVDAAEIATTLDGMQIPHRYADGGAAIWVPEEAVYDTRMKLVAQGVPHGGSVGFEVFKDSDFGVTEFAQRVNYQRALQGELERTIGALPEVASVRVHLTLRRATMFETQDAASKASVSLGLRPGRSLEPKQVVGIQRLVASAVDGLAAEGVVVLGEGGSVLSGAGRYGDGADDQAQIEARLRQRIDGMLRQSLGPDAELAVSVDVRLNYDRIKQVKDKLLPQGRDGNGLVTRQKTSNSHPSVNPADTDPARPVSSSGESELEFAHSREQEEVELAPGRIERISVGILVPASVDAATLAKLDTVIAAAAGLDSQRGDRLDIAALPAHARLPLAAAPVPLAAATPMSVSVPAPSVIWWLWPASGLAVALLGIVLGLLARRMRQPRRIGATERERVLAEIRQWLEAPERL